MLLPFFLQTVRRFTGQSFRYLFHRWIGTIGKERHISDKERLEFVAQKGAKGIDEIFKDKPTEMAAFLEKHILSKDYASYKELCHGASDTGQQRPHAGHRR